MSGIPPLDCRDNPPATSKSQWREHIRACRRKMRAEDLDRESRAIAANIATLGLSGTVCGFVPVGREPGGTALIEALAETGVHLLLPIALPDGVLDWAPYEGAASLSRTARGLTEPVGRRLGPGAIAQASTILVPALAVDRSGNRLGQGGGYYDRALPLRNKSATVIAVVREEEVVPQLPTESFDHQVDAALTPIGLIRLR